MRVQQKLHVLLLLLPLLLRFLLPGASHGARELAAAVVQLPHARRRRVAERAVPRRIVHHAAVGIEAARATRHHPH